MNKPKIILFDVDQVLIRPPHYYSLELEKQGYKNAGEILNSFYLEEDYNNCSEGKADALELIAPYLQKIGWEKKVKEYFIEQFEFEEKYLDKSLIADIKKLKLQNIKCYLATDQEKNRAKYILEDTKFKDIFDKHFVSYIIGHRKCSDKFWEYVLKELKKEFANISADEIAFFDDMQNNIDTALKFGIKAFLFTDKEQFEKDIGLLGAEI